MAWWGRKVGTQALVGDEDAGHGTRRSPALPHSLAFIQLWDLRPSSWATFFFFFSVENEEVELDQCWSAFS